MGVREGLLWVCGRGSSNTVLNIVEWCHVTPWIHVALSYVSLYTLYCNGVTCHHHRFMWVHGSTFIAEVDSCDTFMVV
jgi:hypothetical protein